MCASSLVYTLACIISRVSHHILSHYITFDVSAAVSARLAVVDVRFVFVCGCGCATARL